MTGYPILSAISRASSTFTAIPASGMGISSFSIMPRNRSLSSAMSMTSGEVPRMRTPFFFRSAARFKGV